ncbi:hypothetical protein WN944_004187 [Citrus x changshan-huyou]|uniref:Protein kinase domain-containing protein n=1 Tax=Citrus x changshan-huyou TaxID=2935761 RepID=A0AAP0M3G5_9ROSI
MSRRSHLDRAPLVLKLQQQGTLKSFSTDAMLREVYDAVTSSGSQLLAQRLNIAIDVASALDYLHNRYDTPIARCDLKPSNVLFDEDMIAHVGGFGLANSSLKHQKILQKSICIYWLRGSIGYIPPGIIVKSNDITTNSCTNLSYTN